MSRSSPWNVTSHGVILAGALVICTQSAAAQSLSENHGEQTYRAVRVDVAPEIDGDLSDPVWQQADVIGQLMQQIPVRGGQPSQKTEVRFVYDDTALYVAFHAYESDPAAVTRSMLRYRWDSVWQLDDVVRFSIDTFHDHRRGYAFSFNAFGTKQDAQLDNGSWLPNWDEVWDVRTQVREDGWTAEVRVPFRVIRFPEGRGEQVWGLQIERHIKRTNEIVQWAVAPTNFGLSRLEYAGHLEGISAVEPRRNAQVVPYVAAGRGRSRGRTAETTRDIGADAKVALGPALALDLTYNTNFAQVEVDDQQVNLTRFPLFFPEKREFFLESSQLFNVGLGQDVQMFFSRRIGLAGGQPLPLLGGARLTGKVGPLDVGVLTTQTDSENGIPGANQSAGRVRWNVGSRSYLGGIVTSAASDARRSQTVAADGRVWLGRYLQADGFVSMLNDRDTASHPMAYSGALVYEQDVLGFTARTSRVDDDFDPALGFVRRRDYLRNEARLRRGWRLNRQWARKLDVSGELSYLTNLDGRLDTRESLIWISNELASGDIVRLTMEGTFDRLDATDEAFVIHPREGIVIPAGDYSFRRWIMAYQGFDGRAFTANVEAQGGRFYGGDRSAVTFSGTWRPSPHLVLTGDYQINDVDLPQGAFTTHLQRARVTVPFTARAVADAFVQWNGLTQEINTQVRLHLIYGRDSNLFIVYTDHQTDVAGRLIEQSRALQTKLTYRWYW
jgi:hypothetical protein